MTRKYKATFEVPALVRVELELDADNQQEGLIAAHDLIQQARPADATVISLQLEKAMNVSFEPVMAVPTSPPGPLDSAGQHTVKFFEGNSSQVAPVKICQASSYAVGKQLAETVLAADSLYGLAVLEDELGHQVMKAQAPRGGWEVISFHSNEDAQGTAHSWLDSRTTAVKTALTLLKRTDVLYVHIVDFTDRQTGPRLYREIR